MKKKILSIAMAVIATMAISANAQKPGACPENQQCANHCTAEKAQCSPQDCKLFEGINLNEKQKAQFKELKEKCAKERKEACAAKKTGQMPTRCNHEIGTSPKQAKPTQRSQEHTYARTICSVPRKLLCEHAPTPTAGR